MKDVNKNSLVYLEPEEHVYHHKVTGEKYTSVTKILSSFEEVFDEDTVAGRIAKQPPSRRKKEYLGLNKEEILALWKKINDDANIFGNKIHDTIENYLLNDKFFFPKDDFSKKIIKAYNELDVDEGREVLPEKIVFSEKYKLAGSIDLPIIIDDNFFDIGDWKTNKDFGFYSKYGKCLLPPLDHLQDCKYTIYTLQLSIYAYMLEMETGLKCRQLWIGYFNRDTLKFEKIPVTYMKFEVKTILDTLI